MPYSNNLLTTTATRGLGSLIWTVISFVVALIGCFVVYFLFVKKKIKTDKKYVSWAKDFLSFDIMLIEPMLKIGYIFVVIFITLSSFALIGTSFLSFLMMLIFGNLSARIVYELLLIKRIDEINIVSITVDTKDFSIS